MKVDMRTELKDLQGQPIKRTKAVSTPQGVMLVDAEEVLTLRYACTESLMSSAPNENADGNEKFARYKISLQINVEDEPDLKTDDIAKIKTLIGRTYGPLVVGRCYELLERGASDVGGKVS